MNEQTTCVVAGCPLADRCLRKTIIRAERAVSYFCEGANVGTRKCLYFIAKKARDDA